MVQNHAKLLSWFLFQQPPSISLIDCSGRLGSISEIAPGSVAGASTSGTGVQPDVILNADAALLTAYTKALEESKPRVTGSDDLAQERLKATRDPQAALN